MSIFTIRDENTQGLFEFNFKIGKQLIPPGYDWETFNTYSNFIFEFDIARGNGFEKDLGTGLKNMSEVGCKPVQGLSISFMGRLKCVLKIGTGQ